VAFFLEALVVEAFFFLAAAFFVVFFVVVDVFALAMGVFRGQGKPVSVDFCQPLLVTLKKYSADKR